MRQEGFVPEILCCQLESLNVYGEKDAKEKHLREALAVGGFHDTPTPCPSRPRLTCGSRVSIATQRRCSNRRFIRPC